MSSIVTVRDARGIRWEVNASYTPLFVAGHSPDPAKLMGSGDCAPIKVSPARAIFATKLRDGGEGIPVVIKVYRHPKIGDWLKANLIGSKGRREWDITARALELGLPVATPVAYGERRRFGFVMESYLITVRLFECVTLEELLFSADGTLRAERRVRGELIILLAALLRQMHDRGIYHRDLHPGNFLVGKSAGGGRIIHLLDLHRASVCAGLSLARRISSLAQFNMFASLSLSRSERLLFLNSYFGGDRPWREERRRLLARIDGLTRGMRWRLWRRRERRCLKEGKYSLRLAFGGLKGIAWRSRWRGEISGLLLPSGMERAGARLIKRSRSKMLWEKTLDSQGGGRAIIIKHYLKKRWLKALTYLLRPSQAMRSWRGAYILQIRNIGTLDVVAAVERRGFINSLLEAYLVSEKIEGAKMLPQALSDADGELKRRLIRSLAVFLRTVHERGAYHGDMKATNILVRFENCSFGFFLSDLDFVRASRRLSAGRVARNFIQLNKSLLDLSAVSVADRARFLKDYCGRRRRDKAVSIWKRCRRGTERYMAETGRRFYRGER